MSDALAFNFNLQPKQNELIQIYENSIATKIGLGGSRGGAKSHTADDLMLIRRLKYPKTSGLLAMRLLDDVKDIHIRPLMARFPFLNDWYNKQDKIVTFPNGSFFRFISIENLDELKKRAGRGFCDIMIDQSELFTQEEIEFFGTINRYVPIDGEDLDVIPKMLLTFNPGGIGHTYHKRIFVEKNFEENEDPQDFAFLQTFGWDNAFWCTRPLKKDGLKIEDYLSWDNEKRFNYFIERSQYGRKLNQLPESQRKAQLLGDFDVFEGQFFSAFRRNIHVIPYTFNPAFNRIAGLDYGNTTVIEIMERDYAGAVCVCGEVYCGQECETPTDRAEKIADYLIDKNLNNLTISYDTNMEQSQISNVGYDKTPIDIFRQVFQRRMKDKAPSMHVVSKKSLDSNKGYREAINEAVKDHLQLRKDADGKSKSRLYFGNCPMLIKTLPELIYDSKNPNSLDFDNSQNNAHCYDAFKMGFQEIYTPSEPEKPRCGRDRDLDETTGDYLEISNKAIL